MVEYSACENCFGVCCAGFSTPCALGTDEVARIAEYLEIPLDVFKELYVVNVEMSEAKPWTFKQGKPCRFWTQGRCGIHAVKPEGCALWKPYGNNGEACGKHFRKESEEDKAFPWWDLLNPKWKPCPPR
jgi:Fe-S-cluster containining protein